MLSELIKRRRFDFCNTYLVDPSTISMSRETIQSLIGETHWEELVCTIGEVMTEPKLFFYGMEVVENNDLPRGMFVIGGVIGKEERSKTE